jgi:hypothetical protein
MRLEAQDRMALEGESIKKHNAGFWLKKAAMISSWLLLVSVALLVVSGWGITQTGAVYNATGGLIDRRTADTIHRAVVFPLVCFFLCHVFINVWLGIKNKNKLLKRIVAGLMLAAGAGILYLVIYMGYIRLGG